MIKGLQLLRFSFVGRKHIEKVKYSKQECEQFSNFLRDKNQGEIRVGLNAQKVSRLYVSCIFSRIIGNNFPLSIYLSQSIVIKKDLEVGEIVEGRIQVTKDLGKKKYELSTICKNASGEDVVTGRALILQQ